MSKFLTLNERDIIKWLIVAVLSSSLTTLYDFMNTWVFLWWEQRKFVLMAGITAGLWYIIKNVLTNQEWQLLTKDTEELQ